MTRSKEPKTQPPPTYKAAQHPMAAPHDHLRHHDPQVQAALRRLHQQGDLKMVLTELKNEYIQTLIGTAPDEHQLRDECYQSIARYDDLMTLVENYGRE